MSPDKSVTKLSTACLSSPLYLFVAKFLNIDTGIITFSSLDPAASARGANSGTIFARALLTDGDKTADKTALSSSGKFCTLLTKSLTGCESSIVFVVAGGFLFVKLQAQWLQVLLGLFLISTVFQFQFGKKKSAFPMKAAYFMPLGFTVTFTSTLFGATGPIMNPFYLNKGLVKERMIATKTANSFLAGIAQLSSYAFLGALEGEMWFYGMAIGLGATLGNVIGKRQLKKVSDNRFRQYVIALMVVSGVLMVGKGLV